MNVLCRMNAPGALFSAVPRSIGPRSLTQGSRRNRAGFCVQAGTGSSWVEHACSTAAATTASQIVPVSGGSAAAKVLRDSTSSSW